MPHSTQRKRSAVYLISKSIVWQVIPLTPWHYTSFANNSIEVSARIILAIIRYIGPYVAYRVHIGKEGDNYIYCPPMLMDNIQIIFPDAFMGALWLTLRSMILLPL